MPELEEGNLWIRGVFPMNSSLDATTHGVLIAREIMKRYPELQTILVQVGRPDDGTDSSGFYNSEFFVTLKPESEWPAPAPRSRRRSKPELIEEMNGQLVRNLIGVDWNFSQNIRDNVMESLSGVKGENSVKIIGPDLSELERNADKVLKVMSKIEGVVDVGMFRIMGQSNLSFRVNRDRCAQWGAAVSDVQDVLASAVGGAACSQMIEGERSFDITLRFPPALRADDDAIARIPVDVGNNTVSSSPVPALTSTLVTGAASGPATIGNKTNMPSLVGSARGGALNDLTRTPRIPLGELAPKVDAQGQPDNQHGSYVQPGASTIYREQGQRMIAIKFGVRGRDLAGAVAEAQQKISGLVRPPYRLEWSGEFQEMQQAEGRLMLVVPLAFGMIIILLYMTFRSLTDVLLVLSNVVALFCGGIWALLLTQTNFSISAAVGFISIFGVAIMNGLLLVSFFHRLRLEGLPLDDALLRGSEHRLRPMMMTTLTAIFGLLPAALSTRIGAQTQRPLAIVVIGGMIVALVLNRYLTPVLYSVFRRAPPSGESSALVD
jgi:cobalt-zinc-cadmium resistance protein CzcA